MATATKTHTKQSSTYTSFEDDRRFKSKREADRIVFEAMHGIISEIDGPLTSLCFPGDGWMHEISMVKFFKYRDHVFKGIEQVPLVHSLAINKAMGLKSAVYNMHGEPCTMTEYLREHPTEKFWCVFLDYCGPFNKNVCTDITHIAINETIPVGGVLTVTSLLEREQGHCKFRMDMERLQLVVGNSEAPEIIYLDCTSWKTQNEKRPEGIVNLLIEQAALSGMTIEHITSVAYNTPYAESSEKNGSEPLMQSLFQVTGYTNE